MALLVEHMRLGNKAIPRKTGSKRALSRWDLKGQGVKAIVGNSDHRDDDGTAWRPA